MIQCQIIVSARWLRLEAQAQQHHRQRGSKPRLVPISHRPRKPTGPGLFLSRRGAREDAEAPWIRLAQVSKVFQQGAQTIRAVDQVSLDVAPGEFLAITGASGSGKSTLLHLIAGLETPTSGTVSLGGVALEAMDDAQLSTLRLRTIGFVFQFLICSRR